MSEQPKKTGNSSRAKPRTVRRPKADIIPAPPLETDDSEIAQVLERLPAESRQAVMQIVSRIESHSGWLPTPDYMRQYEAILPGLAERIVALPEREQAHRHGVVDTMVKGEVALKRRGQSFAMASVVLFLCLSGLLVYCNQYEWAAKVAMFGIVGIVGIFVTGKWADVKAAQTTEIANTENAER